MVLKAVLFDFNGVIINDEPIHARLINQLLLEENLRPKSTEFRQFCLGRNDRACLTDLFTHRGRAVTEAFIDRLIARKSSLYQYELERLNPLPIYPGLEDLIFKLRAANTQLAIVSGALRNEIELVLTRAQLIDHFPVIVAGDDRIPSKPAPNGYLLAVEYLNRQHPDLTLTPANCLAIEDTFSGIESAKRAGIAVVGVANTYPFHMLQRRANWAVDYLSDLELDRVQQVYAQKATPKTR